MIDTLKQTIAVHHLEYASSGDIVDANGKEFDATAYSRMKYGSRKDTKHFAEEVALVAQQEAPNIFEDETPPAFLVAYKAIQPACGYLSRYCVDLVNRVRVQNGLEPAEIFKVHKESVTNTDYSKASVEDREAELAAIDFSLRGRRVDDRPVVVLDDIRISGGAERRILEVLCAENQTPTSVLLGYVAVFDSSQAHNSPHVESDINETAISKAGDLIELITSRDGFDLNIRTMKMILSASSEDLDQLLNVMSNEQIEAVSRGAVATGPDFLQKYNAGYQQVVQHTLQRGNE